MSSAVARTACCGTAASFAPAMTSVGAAICGSRLLASWPLIAATVPIKPATVVVRIMDSATSSRSEEHTSELQSLMRISYAVFCLKKKKHNNQDNNYTHSYTY